MKDPLRKVIKTKRFPSTCYWDSSAFEMPLCCEATTNEITFSTTSVLLRLDVPLSLSREKIQGSKYPVSRFEFERIDFAMTLPLANQPAASSYVHVICVKVQLRLRRAI